MSEFSRSRQRRQAPRPAVRGARALVLSPSARLLGPGSRHCARAAGAWPPGRRALGPVRRGNAGSVPYLPPRARRMEDTGRASLGHDDPRTRWAWVGLAGAALFGVRRRLVALRRDDGGGGRSGRRSGGDDGTALQLPHDERGPAEHDRRRAGAARDRRARPVRVGGQRSPAPRPTADRDQLEGRGTAPDGPRRGHRRRTGGACGAGPGRKTRGGRQRVSCASHAGGWS